MVLVALGHCPEATPDCLRSLYLGLAPWEVAPIVDPNPLS